MCRSRRELSNAYLLAKIGVDTAENEPLEVLGGKFNSIFTSLLIRKWALRRWPSLLQAGKSAVRSLKKIYEDIITRKASIE